MFDDWAPRYDRSLREGDEAFPFTGYHDVLAAIVAEVRAAGAQRVLDLGIGTGNLAQLLLEQAGQLEIWGVDFSSRMLEVARRKLPGVRLLQADLQEEVRHLSLPRFDAVVSAYALHELPDAARLALLRHLVADRLEPGGSIVIGDIAFETAARRQAMHLAEAARWDEQEHYFVADEFLSQLREHGLAGTYRQVSPCAGLFCIR